MLILLSPAKKLDFTPINRSLTPTRAALSEESKVLEKAVKAFPVSEVRRLIGVSNDLAKVNHDRYQLLDVEGGAGKPAILAFAGEVYRALDGPSLSDADLVWAQDRVRILSGLYGVLRPLDAIEPHRLEMGTRLKTERGPNLYAFWGDRIAQTLNAALEGAPTRKIVNLASNEYFKAANRASLAAPVVTCAFKEEKNDALRSIMVYAKRARGLMARWIIDNRIDDPSALQGFNVEGYQFDANGSSETELLFVRPKPVA